MVEAARGFFDEFPIERVERENPWHATELARKDVSQAFSRIYLPILREEKEH